MTWRCAESERYHATAAAPTLSPEEFEEGQFIYFDRCSGCHGSLRKGATGPNITDEKMLKKSLKELEEMIWDGTDAGMPGWGRTGEMNREETALMAKYVQLPAPIPPEMLADELSLNRLWDHEDFDGIGTNRNTPPASEPNGATCGLCLISMSRVEVATRFFSPPEKVFKGLCMEQEKWVQDSESRREILLWENFDRDAIMDDFYSTLEGTSGAAAD